MRQIATYITRRHLMRLNREHLRHNPQVAGFSFDLITALIHLYGRYEDDELTFLEERVFPNLPPNGTCLDVGANIGNHALAFAPAFAQVIAFEPHPRTFRLLRLNAELAPNITPLNLAASDAPGEIDVEIDPFNVAATGVGRQWAKDTNTVTFQMQRLDDVPEIQAADPITFFKLDVEGHEAPALKGAEVTLKRHKPLVALEILAQDVDGTSTASLDVLRSFGYDHFYALQENGWLGRLPRRLKKLMRSLMAISLGKRPSKAGALTPITSLEKRSYLMVFCAVGPLPSAMQEPLDR